MCQLSVRILFLFLSFEEEKVLVENNGKKVENNGKKVENNGHGTSRSVCFGLGKRKAVGREKFSNKKETDHD